MRRWPLVDPWLAVAALGALACGDGGDAGTGAQVGTTGASTAVETSTTTLASATQASTGLSAETSTTDDGTLDSECSIWDQDCGPNEKCAPWSAEPDLLPDEVRCCPVEASPVQPGDECVVEGYLGSCLDNCALGSMCLDFDGDGMGTCQEFCSGSAAQPMCEPDEGCFIYFAGVPFCFDICDPLAQDCAEGQGCYPDAQADGGTGFLCLPTIGASGPGGLCWLLSGCAPGLLCVTPDFVPGCNENFGCCTPLCDITESPDPCPAVDGALECVSWYVGGQAPPSAEYLNVGVCVIPP